MKFAGRCMLHIALWIVIPILGFAQSLPPAGGEDLATTFNGLQNTDSVHAFDRPSLRRVNPASMAEVLLPTLETSYLGFFDLAQGAEPVWGGHILNAHLLLPLRAGGLGLGLQFAHLDAQEFDSGTLFHLNASWARTLPGNFSLGLGLNLGLGGHSSSLDWGLSGDLGVQQRLSGIEGLNALNWGLSISGMGKGIRTLLDRDPILAPFTLRAGLGLEIGNPSTVLFEPSLGLSTPGFSNFRLNLQANLRLFEVLSIGLGSSLDIKQVTSTDLAQKSLIPRVSIEFRLPGGGPGFGSSAAPWYGDIWGFGINTLVQIGTADTDGPIITRTEGEPGHISPNNDGVQDRVGLEYLIEDPSGLRAVEFLIHDQSGNLVYQERRELEHRTIGNLPQFFDYLFHAEEDLAPSQSFVIAGKSSSGQVLSDGSYLLTIRASDAVGNIRSIEDASFVIDNSPPQLSIVQPSPESRIFSPNDDGNKDEFLIQLSGSHEDTWKAEILDQAGNVVRSLNFDGAAPEDFVWDGRDDDGNRLPDSVYEFRISGLDQAGNRVAGELTNIILNAIISPVRIRISDPAFSPNSDGVKDSIQFFPELTRTEGVLRWSLDILDSNEQRRRRVSGSSLPPASISFNGNDDQGQPLPDGKYSARFTVVYQSGNTPSDTSAVFEIDRRAPFAQLAKEWTVMSPDGNGQADSMLFYQETSLEESWIGEIRDSANNLVYRRTWEGSADFRWEWNGLDNDTSPVPDGEYFYRLRAEDRAGNRFVTDPVSFIVDTSDSEYLLSLNYRAFSPNADQIRDNLEIRISQQSAASVQSYELKILDRSGKVHRHFNGNSLPPGLSWDGKDQLGMPAPDGEYFVHFNVLHSNGSSYETQIGPVLLDTLYPRLQVSIEDSIFSPNQDGVKDLIRVNLSSSEEDLVLAEILDERGVAVFTRNFRGQAESFDWDGRSDIGNLAADGNYRVRLSSTDAAGNASSLDSSLFTLDTREANAFITLGSRGLAPTNNGLFDRMEFGLYLNLTEGLESWTLRIVDSLDRTVKTFRDSSAQETMSLSWDGKNENGQVVPGSYRAVFEARYTKGDAPQARSSSFLLDLDGPRLRALPSPLPFSPDNDGIADEVNFDISAEDESGVAAWSLQIFDRSNRLFQEFGGQGHPPARVVWDGLSASGERVIAAEDYRYQFSAIDNLGNQSSVAGVITTDIFVIRDGERLYVQIAAISFEPNSPNLVLDQSNPLGVRNSLIMGRLVQLFERYPSYRIRVEGHAVNVTGTEREQVQELIPLSEQRAESVRAALISRGMSPARVSIEGLGGARPLVPHDDLDNRWKNRRVEFILER